LGRNSLNHCFEGNWKQTPAGKRLCFALGAALIVLVSSWIDVTRAAGKDKQCGFENAACLIDLNRAGCAELTLIPGIGPCLAEAIVQYRDIQGPFVRVSDLDRIKGLGPKKTGEIARWAFIEAPGAGAGFQTPCSPRPFREEEKSGESDADPR
jgi:competence ComEA-like helix-hairpin-helix protein